MIPPPVGALWRGVLYSGFNDSSRGILGLRVEGMQHLYAYKRDLAAGSY